MPYCYEINPTNIEDRWRIEFIYIFNSKFYSMPYFITHDHGLYDVHIYIHTIKCDYKVTRIENDTALLSFSGPNVHIKGDVNNLKDFIEKIFISIKEI